MLTLLILTIRSKNVVLFIYLFFWKVSKLNKILDMTGSTNYQLSLISRFALNLHGQFSQKNYLHQLIFIVVRNTSFGVTHCKVYYVGVPYKRDFLLTELKGLTCSELAVSLGGILSFKYIAPLHVNDCQKSRENPFLAFQVLPSFLFFNMFAL